MTANITKTDIVDWLTLQLSEKLNVNKMKISKDKPFADFGLDSIAAVNIAGELEEWLDVEIEVTLLWDYPTINTLSDFIIEENFC